MDSLDTASRVILRLVIILGIAVLFPAVVYLGISAVVDHPQYPDFAGTFPHDESPENRAKFLESLRTMQASYKQAQAAFACVLFWIATPLGLLAMTVGLFRRLGEIGIGFILGGLTSLIFTYCATREHYEVDAVSSATSLMALILLVLIARRRLTNDIGA